MLQQNLPIELPPVTAVLMGTDKFYDALRSLIWEKDETKTGCLLLLPPMDGCIESHSLFGKRGI